MESVFGTLSIKSCEKQVARVLQEVTRSKNNSFQSFSKINPRILDLDTLNESSNKSVEIRRNYSGLVWCEVRLELSGKEDDAVAGRTATREPFFRGRRQRNPPASVNYRNYPNHAYQSPKPCVVRLISHWLVALHGKQPRCSINPRNL